ncbi:N-carbamoyl-L-amino-acid hydrolase [Pseudoxanthobacter soli DSM 19599]|uniref:N-carbamoyl-L-amino-acid hydrolase n=1 Tax=Pseudoxanthobacter soli DSM 19599 TaxID=1123029 RepID=A0A1M7Z801_9HYPH|nr:M20 family metallo-hydrolase [Pseudoxanthobacter soli]SHO60999.1 N-carbamoyl-L-amino-acid hydrolase [Pseudoxanthobacter soli DSM 19599]
MLQNLQIDPKRLWDMLMTTAQLGGTPKGGICRLTLTDWDRQVRDWFKAECEALGCTVTVDEVGNMFAVRPGRRDDIAPIAMGSHLDTQPTGGKFDGVLGVLAGLEVLKTLHGSGYETNAPVMLVNWTNEEGSRFAPAMLGSGVYAGVFDRAYADSRVDRQGVTFAEALDGIGYRGESPAGSVEIGAMFELHIEQGPILEAEGKTIGIVQGVQGIRWYEATVKGQEAHTGSTPMTMRRNALLGATRLIEAVDAIAKARPPAVGTVGLVEVKPNSRNVIPGEVFFSVDFRHPEDAVLDDMEAALEAAVEEVRAATGLDIVCERIWSSPPVVFHKDLIACVREGAATAGYPARDIISGPGHDACYVNRVAPTTMIFVPCKDGISHNEAESTEPGECAAGAQVLLNAVLAYDRTLS